MLMDKNQSYTCFSVPEFGSFYYLCRCKSTRKRQRWITFISWRLQISNNLTAYNKFYCRCTSCKCHCPLQTNQFIHIHDLRIFNQPQHKHNPEKSWKEDLFPCTEDHKFTADEFIYENIHIDYYDRYNSDSDRSSFNNESEIITSNLNLNDSVKWIYIAICSKSIWIVWNPWKNHFYQHFFKT